MALRETYPLHPNKVVKKTISYCLVVALFGIFLAIPVGMFLGPLCIAPPIILLAAVYMWQKEYLKVYFYDLADTGLEIKKGVFFPNSITIPIEKVSDVYVDQDLLDRVFGLYDLHFSSASLSSSTLAHIDGLGKPAMEGLRDHLMAVFKANRGEAPSQDAANAGAVAEQGAGQAPLAAYKPAPSGFWVSLASALLTCTLVLIFIDFSLVPFIVVLALPISFVVKKEFDVMAYEVRKDGIWVRKGWLNPSETVLFYRNIQDIDVNESLLERFVGLKSINVKSMSYISATSAKLSFLSANDADGLQDILRRQIEDARALQSPAQTGAPVRQASAPAPNYTGSAVAKPYKNNFMKGHLLGSALAVAFFGIAGLALLVLPSFLGSNFGFLAIVGGAGVFIAFAIACLSVLSALIDNATYTYALTEAGLEIQLGLLGRSKKVIRYEKIQDIRIYCGFVESYFGLVTVCVETGSKDIASEKRAATNVGITMTERVPYLALSDAKALRAKLMGIARISYPGGSPPLRDSVPLSRKKPLKKTVAYVGIAGVQLLAVFLALALATQGIASLAAWALFALIALRTAIFPIIYKYEELYMQKYFYDENEDTLVIRKGVFGWSEIVVPFRNIQSIYVDQDWYDVYFDLWDVWITTVTAASGPMAHIDGVSREDADRLARLLAGRVEKSRKRGRN